MLEIVKTKQINLKWLVERCLVEAIGRVATNGFGRFIGFSQWFTERLKFNAPIEQFSDE